MITDEQYKKAKMIIERYEQQLNILAVRNNEVKVCVCCGQNEPKHEDINLCKYCLIDHSR